MKTEQLFDVAELQRHKTPENRLYYGDNLTIMRGMPNDSVDLIYLDPPFNSQRSYNLIYKQMTGHPVPEQEEAFCDAWELDPEKEEMARRMPIFLREHDVDENLVLFWDAWIRALRNTQPRLLAYLVYMSYRLFEMKRLLRSAGSIYLHCDPTASHYIKVIMDGIFGHDNFQNEIIWKRTSAHSGAKRYGPIHDVILFYSMNSKFTWNVTYGDYDQQYVDAFFTHKDEQGRKWRRTDLTGPGIRKGDSGLPWRDFDPTLRGRHWQPASYFYDKYKTLSGEDLAQYPLIERLEKLDSIGLIHWPQKRGGMPQGKRLLEDAPGLPLQDIWTDIKPIHNISSERLGYPTQKPTHLLERIIKSSTSQGDVVFDPFCGCGTSIYAAHLNERAWIGCDIAILSVRIVRDVLLKRYGLKEGIHYQISGIPLSVDGAYDLFKRDPHQFQHWAVELAGGFCSKKKSGDQGIDGRIYFETSNNLDSMVLSVKGGHLAPAHVRELRGVLERESSSKLAGFICLEKPTHGMKDEAAKAGMFTYLGKDYPRLQIRTIDDLLGKISFDTPSKVQTMNRERQGVLPLR